VIPFGVKLGLVCCRPLHGAAQCLAIKGIIATDRTQRIRHCIHVYTYIYYNSYTSDGAAQRSRQSDGAAPRHGTHPFLDATGFKAGGTHRRCMGTRDQYQLDVLPPAILPAPSTTTPTII